MNSITINNKQYIYIKDSEQCSECDLYHPSDKCKNICVVFGMLLGDKKAGIFKELKIE